MRRIVEPGAQRGVGERHAFTQKLRSTLQPIPGTKHTNWYTHLLFKQVRETRGGYINLLRQFL